MARNLAEAFSEQGKRVILLDSGIRNPEQIREAGKEADYVLIDAPACQNLSKVAPMAEQAEAILYVIRQD